MRVIFSFMIKCIKVELKPRMRAFQSVIALKANSSGKLAVYASYRSSTLAFFIFKSFYRWSDSFFFIHFEVESWAFRHI